MKDPGLNIDREGLLKHAENLRQLQEISGLEWELLAHSTHDFQYITEVEGIGRLDIIHRKDRPNTDQPYVARNLLVPHPEVSQGRQIKGRFDTVITAWEALSGVLLEGVAAEEKRITELARAIRKTLGREQ